nr:MAG TPA: Rifin [Crassvirales sp.]
MPLVRVVAAFLLLLLLMIVIYSVCKYILLFD